MSKTTEPTFLEQLATSPESFHALATRIIRMGVNRVVINNSKAKEQEVYGLYGFYAKTEEQGYKLIFEVKDENHVKLIQLLLEDITEFKVGITRSPLQKPTEPHELKEKVYPITTPKNAHQIMLHCYRYRVYKREIREYLKLEFSFKTKDAKTYTLVYER